MNNFKKKKMYSAGVTSLVIAGFVLVFNSSCSRVPSLQMVVAGTKDLNNGGYAVLVCLYQLKNNTNFIRTPLESFWQERGKALESDLSAPPMDIMLAPEESKKFPLQLSPGTLYIGAAADFRKPNLKEWRQILSVADLEFISELKITVSKNGLKIEPLR